MRKRFLASLTSILLLAGCAVSVNNNADLVFADFRFQVPENPSTLAVQDNELLLALRYGPEAGEDYLIFTKDPAVPTNGCPPDEFFSRAVENKGVAGGDECDPNLVEDFKTTFVAQTDSGIWLGEGFKAYYLLQENKSMVYLVGANGGYVKVDTDLLTADELEALVAAVRPL